MTAHSRPGDAGWTYRLGGQRIGIVGEHEVLDLVRRELAACETPDAPEIVIRGRRGALEPLAPRTELDGVAVQGPIIRLRFERAGIEMEVRTTADGTAALEVDACIGERPMPLGVPRRLFRWLEPTFQTPEENQAYLFIRYVLESVVFLFGGTTVALHAAALEREGRAVVLTSAGGVGKTGTSSALMRRGGWNYLSDDITFVDASGAVATYPRSVMLYGYNVAADRHLRRTIRRSGGPMSRIQWTCQRVVRPGVRRRRIPPGMLYGAHRVGHGRSLELVAFLARKPTGEPVEVIELDPREMARRSTAILENEFGLLLERLRLAEAMGSAPLREVSMQRHGRVLESVFSAADRLVELSVRNDVSVEAVADRVEALLSEDR